MSKQANPIKEKIFQHALKRFNDSGIEQVGMRELASELDMHVGNLTYYFATKNDLLNEIARRLGEANAQLLGSEERPGIDGFLNDIRDIFINQWTYRCVVVSLVNILRQNPEAAARYVLTQAERRNGIRARILDLRTAGFLDPNLSDTTIAKVSESISMIGRFWVNDKLTSHPEWDLDRSMDHYIELIGYTLSQSCSQP
jgi:AcrR family transcriptional regulator